MTRLLRDTQPPAATAMGGGINLLPDDVLAEILARLRDRRSIARCRSVCGEWRALVDDRALLLPHPILRAFPGFFATAASAFRPVFLSSPSAAGGAVGWLELDFLRGQVGLDCAAALQDHCNGLLLCFRVDCADQSVAAYVCNPATRRWACLPRPAAPWPPGRDGAFLAFDPEVSPEHRVFLLPVGLPRPREFVATESSRCPWPVPLDLYMPESSPGEDELAPPGKKAFPVRVFSSADGKWRRGALAPGRCAPEHLYDRVMALCRLRTEVKDARVRRWRSAEYCRGALYAHSESHVLVVLRWAEGTYDMVELPDGGKAGWVRYPYMHVLAARPLELVSSSPDGGAVRYAKVTMSGRVRIWALEESSSDDGGGGGGKLEWTLTHDKDLADHPRLLEPLDDDTLDSLRMMALSRSPGNDDDSASAAATAADDDEEEDAVDGWSKRWSWDEAMVSMPEVDTEPKDEAQAAGTATVRPFHMVGFHPSKEVLFLAAGAFHVVAYHLGSGKVQYLGRATSRTKVTRVDGMFPYRPSFVDALPSPPCSFPSLNAAKSRRRY